MKNLFSLTLALMTLGLVVSCGAKSTPGAAAKQYMEYLADGRIDKFLEGFRMDEDEADRNTDEYKAQLKAFGAKIEASLAEQGGLKEVEILSETIAEDGQSAEVELKQTFGNGESEESSVDMVLVDGTWKMEPLSK